MRKGSAVAVLVWMAMLSACSGEPGEQGATGEAQQASKTDAVTVPAGGWTAENSDPESLGWMQGFPPPEDRVIRFTDGRYFNFPQLRWTVCHFRQLMPTVAVRHGDSIRQLPLGELAPLASLGVQTLDGRELTFAEALAETFTDGFLVLHRGKVVFEHYDGCLDAQRPHGAMSMTKSMVGLLAEVLVARGELDDSRTMLSYIPELEGSAFADASVREVMDMTTALKYSEDYSDPDAEVWRHAGAGNPLPKPPGYDGPRFYYESVQEIKKQGEHGEAFAYKTVNTDALGWLLARVTGKPVESLFSDMVWAPMGAQQSAYFTVDSIGTAFAGGGLNLTLRDLARVGQLMLEQGRVGDQQVIPESAVRAIAQGGDPALFAKSVYGKKLTGWSYRGMWWHTHNDHRAYMARGVHGQALYIDPVAQMVIARFASHPNAANAAIDPVNLPLYEALGEHFKNR
jgi:CubicO group peptidase (beta-lactamase class C family)